MRDDKSLRDQNLQVKNEGAEEAEKFKKENLHMPSIIRQGDKQNLNEESLGFNMKNFIKDNPHLHVGQGTLGSEIKMPKVQNGGKLQWATVKL